MGKYTKPPKPQWTEPVEAFNFAKEIERIEQLAKAKASIYIAGRDLRSAERYASEARLLDAITSIHHALAEIEKINDAGRNAAIAVYQCLGQQRDRMSAEKLGKRRRLAHVIEALGKAATAYDIAVREYDEQA